MRIPASPLVGLIVARPQFRQTKVACSKSLVSRARNASLVGPRDRMLEGAQQQHFAYVHTRLPQPSAQCRFAARVCLSWDAVVTPKPCLAGSKIGTEPSFRTALDWPRSARGPQHLPLAAFFFAHRCVSLGRRFLG